MLALMVVPEAAFAASPSARKMEELCRPAAMAAEIDAELPQGVLLAIAHVESGRRDPASGATIPWPWSINAEGVPMVFNTREEAVAAVEELQGRNIRSIDVGCMQVNLQHHPDAFPSLREAFDPAVNARYAARFLARLRDSSGSWEAAIGRYHSATPGRSEAYRDRVLAVWSRTSPRSPADIQRERVAMAWTQAQGDGGRPGQMAATPLDRPRGSRDPVEQIAAFWQRTHPGGGASRRTPSSALPRTQLARGPSRPGRPQAPLDLRFSIR